MSSGWRKVQLCELCTLRAGSAFKPKYQGRLSGEFPFIKVSDMNRSANQRWIQDAANWVSGEDAGAMKARPFPEGTIVFAKIGEALRANRVRLLTRPTIIDNNMMGAIPNAELIRPEFLAALLEDDRLERYANGTALPYLTQGVLNDVEYWVPSLDIQDEILRVTDGLERLIENNRRRIETLEEMARLVYREWFVHFRFPGHEEIRLVDSDLGPIPYGWEMNAVGDVADLVRGRSYRATDLVEPPEGRPFLNLKCIDRGGGFRKSGLKRYDGPFKEEQLARPGDTVIAVTDMTQERNIVAQAGRVPRLPEGSGVISLDLARVLPSDAVEGDYLYAMFRYSRFSSEVKEHANGTNVLHLTPDRIREFRFVVPSVELQKSFRDVVRPMYGLIDNLELQSETLAQARDLLLPRLISGELNVSDLDLDLEPVL